MEWGNDILTTGLFAIIICGTLGVLAIHFSAPVLLKTAAVKSSDGESTDGEDRNGANELPGTVSRDPFSSGGADAVRMPSVNVADHRQGSLDDQMRVGPGALSIDALKRNASTDTVPNSRPGSPTVPVTHLTVTGEDFDLLADYIDAVQKLTLATQTGEREGPEMVLMSARVVDLQRRIEEGVARKEPSVRELFRTASLRGRRPMRAASRASVASRSGTDLPSSRHNGGGTGYKSAEDAV